jgi:hypothetical protein
MTVHVLLEVPGEERASMLRNLQQVFLASSDSAFVTGTELIVDGGVSHI